MTRPGWDELRPTDPASSLLFNVARILNARGHDLLKKRMWKDGHLFGDDAMQYLRVRKPSSKAPHIYIFHGNYAVEDACEVYNKNQQIDFAVEFDVFGKQPDCIERLNTLEAVTDEELLVWATEHGLAVPKEPLTWETRDEIVDAMTRNS